MPENPERPLFWGGVELPLSFATQNFLVAGTIGSGKTATLDLLLKSILPSVKPGSDTRVFIYDAKGEAYSKLQAFRVPEHSIRLIQPFDARSAAWDIARDITRPEDVHALASLLFPVRQGMTQPFFEEAAGALLRGVMLSLNRVMPGRWTLRDALLAMGTKHELKEVLSLAPEENLRRLSLYFENPKTINDIMSTIANRIEEYEVIATYWHEAPEKVSLEEWVGGESFLILGASHRSEQAVKAINTAVFHRLTQLLLDKPNSTTRTSWLFLDEVSKAGKLDGLDQLLTRGRSKGVRAVLGFQDIAGLEATYGDKITQELTGQVGNKAILRLNNPKTAEWAELVFSDKEIVRWNESQSSTTGAQSSTETSGVSEHREVTPLVRRSQFMSIEPLNPPRVNELGGFYHTPGIGAYPWSLPLSLIKQELPPLKDDEQAYLRTLSGPGYLRPWTPAERQGLGIPPPLDPHASPSPPQTPKPPEDEDLRLR